jgi:hypothetical protein
LHEKRSLSLINEVMGGGRGNAKVFQAENRSEGEQGAIQKVKEHYGKR